MYWYTVLLRDSEDGTQDIAETIRRICLSRLHPGLQSMLKSLLLESSLPSFGQSVRKPGTFTLSIRTLDHERWKGSLMCL